MQVFVNLNIPATEARTITTTTAAAVVAIAVPSPWSYITIVAEDDSHIAENSCIEVHLPQ